MASTCDKWDLPELRFTHIGFIYIHTRLGGWTLVIIFVPVRELGFCPRGLAARCNFRAEQRPSIYCAGRGQRGTHCILHQSPFEVLDLRKDEQDPQRYLVADPTVPDQSVVPLAEDKLSLTNRSICPNTRTISVFTLHLELETSSRPEARGDPLLCFIWAKNRHYRHKQIRRCRKRWSP